MRRAALAIGFVLCLGALPGGGPLLASTVCVLTPRLSLNARAETVAAVSVPSPTILSTESLEEVRILRDGELLWQQRAQPARPIEGPIPWPLDPIRPGERLELLLRPPGVQPDDFAVIVLEGDTAERMEQVRQDMERLGRDPTAWWAAIQQAFDREDMSLGLALLFAFDGPSSPRLDNLRRAVFLAGCGSGSEGVPGQTGRAAL